MSDVAALIADMVRAGVDPELIGRTAAALAEREAVVVPDVQAERRRAKDRKRKEEERLRNSADSADETPSLEVSPHTPLPKPNQSPPSPPKGGSSPTGFDEFWSRFPNRVGKGAAVKAFASALKRAPLEAILLGVERYAAKTDDRPWCNPATFLNQNRWTDEPAAPVRPNSTAPPGRMTPSDANRILTEMEHERQAQRSHEIAGIIRPGGGDQPGRADSLVRGAVNRAFD